MKSKKFFWDYLYYTRLERQGIVFLLALSLLMLCLPTLYERFYPHRTQARVEVPDRQLGACAAADETAASEEAQAAQAFSFDPNTADAATFQALGLPQRTVKGILNYRSKGGQFRHPDDFAKIYTLSESDFERLRPWIVIGGQQAAGVASQSRHKEQGATQPQLALFDPNAVTATDLGAMGLPDWTVKGWLNYRSKGGTFKYKTDVKRLYQLSESDYQRIYPYIDLPEKTTAMATAYPATPMAKSVSAPVGLDINSATVEEWVQLPGIGAGWAHRILDWREKLGGFVTVEQIAEMRNLPDSVYQKARPFLKVGRTAFKTVNINAATWEELNRHPYIESKHARWIVAYRTQHGNFGAVDDLLRISTLKKDWLDKVRPYLSV